MNTDETSDELADVSPEAKYAAELPMDNDKKSKKRKMSTELREESNVAHPAPEMRSEQEYSALIQAPYLAAIQTGRKTREGRICSGVFKKLTPGDRLRFNCKGNTATVRILSVHKYSSFRDMLNDDLKQYLPDTESLEEGWCCLFC